MCGRSSIRDASILKKTEGKKKAALTFGAGVKKHQKRGTALLLSPLDCRSAKPGVAVGGGPVHLDRPLARLGLLSPRQT